MLNSELSEIIKTKRLRLRGWNKFWHYSPVFPFLIFPIIYIYFTLKMLIDNNSEVLEKGLEGFYYVIAFFIISVIIFIYKFKALDFRIINKQITTKQFKNAVYQTEKELKWRIIVVSNKLTTATSYNSLGSWGEYIIIIRTENQILINSLSDYRFKPSLTSWGENKRNRITFEQNLKRACV